MTMVFELITDNYGLEIKILHRLHLTASDKELIRMSSSGSSECTDQGQRKDFPFFSKAANGGS
jgi:hypothetical protein